MRIYIGFDDTDTYDAGRGTGKLARFFESRLPEGCSMWGVVREQLLIHEKIPYTSHNSAACVIVDLADSSLFDPLVLTAAEHIESLSFKGSDPGLCIARQDDPSLHQLVTFGQRCTRVIVTQREALQAASNVHLSAHGGTNDGIIGAAAAVGLTVYGWAGRFIEFGGLRHVPDVVRVSDLERMNILVVSIDRNAKVPAPEDLVYTKYWLRPLLLAGRAVLIVRPKDNGAWESLGEKRRHKRSPGEMGNLSMQNGDVRNPPFASDDIAL
jgi:hypothetical protein